jgi:hypothetical protein
MLVTQDPQQIYGELFGCGATSPMTAPALANARCMISCAQRLTNNKSVEISIASRRCGRRSPGSFQKIAAAPANLIGAAERDADAVR